MRPLIVNPEAQLQVVVMNESQKFGREGRTDDWQGWEKTVKAK